MSDVVPASVQLGAVKVTAMVTRLDDGTFGDSQVHPDAIIRIDDRLDQSSQAMTVIHELLHVVSDHFNLDLSERQVCCLEQAISSIMFQNPELVPALQNAIRRPTIHQDLLAGSSNTETASGQTLRS